MKPGTGHFVTNRVDASLAQTLQEKDVVFSSKPESTLLPTLLSWLVPIKVYEVVGLREELSAV